MQAAACWPHVPSFSETRGSCSEEEASAYDSNRSQLLLAVIQDPLFCLLSCHAFLHLTMRTGAKRTTLHDYAIPSSWNSTLLWSTLGVSIPALNAMELGITAPPVHASSLPCLPDVTPTLVPVRSALLSARSCRYQFPHLNMWQPLEQHNLKFSGIRTCLGHEYLSCAEKQNKCPLPPQRKHCLHLNVLDAPLGCADTIVGSCRLPGLDWFDRVWTGSRTGERAHRVFYWFAANVFQLYTINQCLSATSRGPTRSTWISASLATAHLSSELLASKNTAI